MRHIGLGACLIAKGLLDVRPLLDLATAQINWLLISQNLTKL